MVGGGALVCLRATTLNKLFAKRCALKATSTVNVRAKLIDSGLFAFKKNIAADFAGLNFCLPILRNKLRMFIVTSPKSISTGQGDKHLWHTVQ